MEWRLQYLHEREVSHRGKELIKPPCAVNDDIPDIKVTETWIDRRQLTL